MTTDAKLRAESSLLELCRDAKEENSKLLNAGRKHLWTTAILSPKIKEELPRVAPPFIMFNAFLLYGNLVYTCLMASTLKVGCEELLHDGRCGVGIDEASRHDKYVGVIVLTDEVCYLGNPTQSCTYALVLVESHGDTLSTATDGDAGVAFTFLYGLGQGMRVVGVVTAVGTVGAKVLILPAFGVEPLLYIFFQFVTSMVAGKTYSLHNLQIKGEGVSK